MIPAFAQKHWFAEFLQRGVQALESQAYDAVLKLPLHDFSGQGQLLQLTAVARRPRDFVGAFIIAAEPDSISGELRRLCSRAGFPVIFVDVMPFARPEDLPAWSCYVGSDQNEIGVAAARYVADQMAQRQKRRPRVLVIGSAAQAERQRTFVAALKDKLPGAVVEVNDHGAFVRDRSREIAGRYLRSARQEGRLLDAIFCTNDEMALGALDALHEDAVSEGVHSDLIVVGVDGTDEAMSVIRSGGTQFRATVVQDSRRIAETATAVLLRALEGERPQPRIIVPVSIYPPGHNA
ncbi:hypothetical protein Prum_069320 [Phytohabitans rumicis]|uniref:Periplasmic binding protein domain-containing protein n=2 Tax=Phytohabitans rumicis TaxID=1076125 RepID=A0A6V8LCB9_9ACTN|nr:hypothetical protein Prum_069320 [Phytohabitans rumicis]